MVSGLPSVDDLKSSFDSDLVNPRNDFDSFVGEPDKGLLREGLRGIGALMACSMFRSNEATEVVCADCVLRLARDGRRGIAGGAESGT